MATLQSYTATLWRQQSRRDRAFPWFVLKIKMVHLIGWLGLEHSCLSSVQSAAY